MEVNKDEAARCRDMGAEALRSRNYPRAVKLLRKSLSLYPLPGVQAILCDAERKLETCNGEGASSSAHNDTGRSTNSTRQNIPPSAPPRRTASTMSGSDGREYTEEQVKIVAHILTMKEKTSSGLKPHYRVLGIEVGANDAQIKKAYRKLALKLHPDKNSAPKADEAFKAVGLAYATLSDPQKRSVYDRYGEEDPDNRGGGASGAAHFRRGQEVSPEEIFNMFFGGQGMPGGMGGPGFRVYTNGFGGGFQQFPRQQRRQPQQQQQQQGAWSQFIQLIPLVLFLVLSFINFPSDDSGATGGSRYFSLTSVPPYVNPLKTRLTHVKDIPYFVTEDFLRTYYRDRYQLAQVERIVEKSYESYLINECKNQKVYKSKLERNAKTKNGLTNKDRERELKKARDFELTRCLELQDLFPRRQR